MDRGLIVVVVLGILIALAGLAVGIYGLIVYRFDSMLTIIFFAVFIVGLLVAGIAWSE